MVAGCGSGGTALCLCFRIFLLAALPAGGLPWPSVRLEATVTVQRGLTTDVNPIITGLEPQLTHCVVRQVPQTAHLSCGSLHPSSVHCEVPEALTYRHYGCSSTRDLLHLQLLASRNVSTAEEQYVRFFSVEIVVDDYSGRLVQLETISWPSDGYTYTRLTPVFPPEWVGKCYYKILRSLLPTAEVQGMVNSPLPCGYVPRDPFLLLEDAHQNRSVLMEVTGTVHTMPELLQVLLFANSTVAEPLALPATYLQVLQFSHTPVTSDILPCPHSSHQCIYTFPVLPTGTFVPAYSPSKPQSSITKFTSEDIAAGTVVFVPNEIFTTFPPTVTSNTYEYSVFDYANHILARSVVEVTVFNAEWTYPVLRFVASPHVQSGGRVSMNNTHLLFYIQPNSYCERNTSVALSRSPNHGTWTISGIGGGGVGRNLAIGEPFSHRLLQNGTLVYQHDGHSSSAAADATVWNVTCDGRTFQLAMTLLIIPETGDWYPLPKVQPSTLITFCGRASPLMLNNPVYPNSSLRFDVNATQGAVVRLNRDLDTLSVNPFPPYMDSDSLVPHETVTQFSIDELQDGLIWYIPVCPATNLLKISIHEAQQSSSIHSSVQMLVLNSTVPLEEFLLLSSTRRFMRVVKNQSLPVVSAENAVYITTTFLYTRSDVASSSAITYRVVESPQYGHLTFAYLESDFSISRFTQADLDRFKIVYRPHSESHHLFRQNNDSFSFELIYRDVGLTRRLTGVFRMFAAWAEPLVVSEDQLWVEPGGSLTIPPDPFRDTNILPLRTARFQLLTAPQFGDLVMPNGTNYTSGTSLTFSELRRNRLQYHHVGKMSCNDSFTFSASNTTHSVNKTVTIAIRQRHDKLLGLWEVTKLVLAQENFVFTSQDFLVLSDFCFQFVQFTVQAEPTMGHLRLFQPSLHTFIQVQNNSVFSAEDVKDGRLWYMANHQHLNSSLTADRGINEPQTMKFYLSDPKNFRDPDEQFNQKISIDYEVTFLQPTEVRIHTVFNTRDIYILSWIPELGRFGYVFQEDDIRVDSTPDLRERDIRVKILIKESPRKGWIERDGQPVSEGREGQSLGSSVTRREGKRTQMKGYRNEGVIDKEKGGVYATKNFQDKKLLRISQILECRKSFFHKFSASLVSRACQTFSCKTFLLQNAYCVTFCESFLSRNFF